MTLWGRREGGQWWREGGRTGSASSSTLGDQQTAEHAACRLPLYRGWAGALAALSPRLLRSRL